MCAKSLFVIVTHERMSNDMKNQYVADIGDFGKYSLFRAFAEEGIKVGINWYLTADDASNDAYFHEITRNKLI